MGTEALHELTAAYALDALDDDERREYEAHLARCESCRDELATLSEAAASLAYAVEAPAPSVHLRERILASARAERPNVVPLRPRWAVPAAATALVAIAAAIVLAVWATSLSSKLDRERTLASEQERVAAILASPSVHPYAVPNGGLLAVTPGGEAALVLTRLEPARNGMTYEAWVAENGKPRPAGTFDAGRDVTAVPLDVPVPRGATVMVTQEKAGGTALPTHPPFITVNTAA
jgi:anti-sigma-K factor RskA